MPLRKIWVQRRGHTPTIIRVREDALIDEVRDVVLEKYANTLGRFFDAPDLALRVKSPHTACGERLLAADEYICRSLDHIYPHGQSIDDAIVVDVPLFTLNSASPSCECSLTAGRSLDPDADDYFSLVSPRTCSCTSTITSTNTPPAHFSHHRLSLTRHNSLPDTRDLSPFHETTPSVNSTVHRPTSLVASSRPASSRCFVHTPPKSNYRYIDTNVRSHHSPSSSHNNPAYQQLSPSRKHSLTSSQAISTAATTAVDLYHRSSTLIPVIEPSIPPINILIVEDNIVNLKLLMQFARRLAVQFQCASNGIDALTKWRRGGFHLVLMDLQLPLLSGIQATKEIRRLERVNGIGILSPRPATPPTPPDRLIDPSLFKSPVIIVALTASSLQNDRQEALAAGCNDYLTKPVNFVWLERKVKEWGCMQALIDYDGWHRWKDLLAPSLTPRLETPPSNHENLLVTSLP